MQEQAMDTTLSLECQTFKADCQPSTKPGARGLTLSRRKLDLSRLGRGNPSTEKTV